MPKKLAIVSGRIQQTRHLISPPLCRRLLSRLTVDPRAATPARTIVRRSASPAAPPVGVLLRARSRYAPRPRDVDVTRAFFHSSRVASVWGADTSGAAGCPSSEASRSSWPKNFELKKNVYEASSESVKLARSKARVSIARSDDGLPRGGCQAPGVSRPQILAANPRRPPPPRPASARKSPPRTNAFRSV